MLVKFKVENWKSFHCLDFSAIAGSEDDFLYRIPKPNDYPASLLPITAIFGGNASGKTNFFDALVFLQRLVRGEGIVGDKGKIDVKPFAFNTEDRNSPTSFEIEFLVDSKIYHYELTVSSDKVFDELLAEVCYDGRLKSYFERKGSTIAFSEEFKTARMGFVGQGTRDKVLFLTNSVQQQCEEFRRIYDWFDKTLLLISPESGFVPSRLLLQPECNDLLSSFDIGFDELAEVDVTLEQIVQDVQDGLDMPSNLRGQFRDRLKLELMDSLFRNQGNPTAPKKIVALHALEDDSEKVPFELKDESAGTRRLLYLLPVFIRLRDATLPTVVFIDELDRNMHHLLTRKLIETYLDECSPKSTSQLFFTTHDMLLLDDSLLRRDEMWVAERNDGASELLSIGDFEIRKGQNLLTSYLRGRFGGIPVIH